MAKLTAKVYGDALFQLAEEEGRVDEFFDAVKVTRQTLKENPELLSILDHPKIVKEEKVQVVRDTFGGRIPQELTELLCLLVEKQHVTEIVSVLDHILSEIKEYKHIGIAHVATAVPLSETQKKEIEQKLLDTTDYKEFEMNYETDPSLIGGIVIRIKDRVVDSSIKTRLYGLTRELSQLQVGEA